MESRVDSEVGTFFQEKGYYVAKRVFTDSELDELEADFDRLVAQLKGSGDEINARWNGEDMAHAADTVVLHTHNVQRYSAAWHRALLHPRFLDVASRILGEDIVLHHTKLFQKPPGKGAPFPIHQDWEYFPSVGDSMIAGIVHLTDASDAMGCVRVFPGSHRLGRLSGTGPKRTNPILKEYPLEEATVLEAERGDIVFFHYFTLHGSMPNRSDRTRKTVLIQLHAGNDEMEENGHPYDGNVLRGWNHRMRRARAAVSAS